MYIRIHTFMCGLHMLCIVYVCAGLRCTSFIDTSIAALAEQLNESVQSVRIRLVQKAVVAALCIRWRCVGTLHERVSGGARHLSSSRRSVCVMEAHAGILPPADSCPLLC